MGRGQIGEAMGDLIGDEIAVAQVLDFEILGLLRVPQETNRPALGHQHGSREIVDLDALSEELRVVAGGLWSSTICPSAAKAMVRWAAWSAVVGR